ncbi:ArdC family protein [Xanthomonas axonopodis]
MSQTDEFAKKISDLMIKALEDNVAPWTKPWKPGEMPEGPHNGMTNRSYRGSNYINLLLTQMDKGYASSEWLTFRQINELGGRVRKGEKRTQVQYWLTQDPTPEDLAQDPSARKKRIPRYYWAFNRDQCEGLPAPKAKIFAPVEWRHEKCEQLMADSGVEFKFTGGDQAYYRPDLDKIYMPSKAAFHSEDGFYATALHELGHSTGHKDRLNRDLSGKFGSEKYAIEELTAEFFSFICGERLGIGHDPGNHISYTKSWLKIVQNDRMAGLRAAAGAERIFTYLKIERYQDLQQDQQLEQEQPKDVVPQKPAEKAKTKPKVIDPLAPEVLDAQIKEMKSRRKTKEMAVAL